MKLYVEKRLKKMNITRNPEIPTEIQLGVTEIEFQNEELNQAMWDELLTPMEQKIENETTLEDIRNSEQIQAIKQGYKKLGKDPSRFRPSSDALWRRVVKGKGLYQINALVDLNNYLSLKYKMPYGSYDLNNVSGDIILTKGGQGQTYKGIGKDAINIENMLVLADDNGPFGSPTSDSTKAMIQDDTSHAIIVAYLFGMTTDQIGTLLADTKIQAEKYLNKVSVTQQYVV
jgi:DNA/RNA-binding domain of Phe-tRNA-synthetase-like protein